MNSDEIFPPTGDAAVKEAGGKTGDTADDARSPIVSNRVTIDPDPARFFGVQDRHLRQLQDAFPDLNLVGRDRELLIEGPGPEVNRVLGVAARMLSRLTGDEELDSDAVRIIIEESAAGGTIPDNYQDLTLLHTNNKRRIYPRTAGQYQYLQAVEANDIVFAIGPAGTGKTYLAVAMAVRALKAREVQRIILARPAVEAGESLGFLPGDLKEKVDPYLRPLYDALMEMIPPDKLTRYLESHTIEVLPLAFMRGRNLNAAFVILDEAQNTTPGQMKMALTRLGVNAKAIVTGDITQIDLPEAAASGLVQIQSILMAVEGISFVYLTEKDVVRHRLVREILRAYQERGL